METDPNENEAQVEEAGEEGTDEDAEQAFEDDSDEESAGTDEAPVAP